MALPITEGTGSASVATEVIGGLNYQQIKVADGEASSTNKWKINTDGSAQVSVVGTMGVTISGTPSISGAVTVVGSSTPPGSVSGQVGASVIGTVPVTQSGTVVTSIAGIPQVSVLGVLRASVAGGTAEATQGTSPWIITGSVQGAFSPSGNQSVSGTVGASVIGIPNPLIITGSVQGAFSPSGNQSVSGTVGASVIGTVPVTQSGTVVTSIAGTPTVIVSSVATAGGLLDTTEPRTAHVQGTADLRVVQGASVVAITAQGVGLFTYVNHVQIANFGSSSVLVKFADTTTSTLGYTIAPAGGGSNFDCLYKTATNNPVSASINGTASVLVSMQGFTSAQ